MTNEEKYKTPKERNEAFEEFCDQYKSCEACYACPCWQGWGCHIDCRFNWLNLEDEEEKPAPCPFCGAKTERCETQVICFFCGYASPHERTYPAAIARHNELCRRLKGGEK